MDTTDDTEYEDITEHMTHRCVAKDKETHGLRTFESWLNSNPALLRFSLRDFTKTGDFSNPKARKLSRDCLLMCLEAREKGYVLAPDTFRPDNIRVCNDRELRLLKVLAYHKGEIEKLDNSDLVGLANFIQNVLFSGATPPDFRPLIKLLNDITLIRSELILLMFNYAFMADALRGDLMCHCWDSAFAMKMLETVGDICTTHHQGDPWISLCRSDPLAKKIFDKGAYLAHRASDQMKFIRNGIKHLTDNNFTPEEAQKIMSCLFPDLMANVQIEFYEASAISLKELEAYFPDHSRSSSCVQAF